MRSATVYHVVNSAVALMFIRSATVYNVVSTAAGHDAFFSEL